MTATIVWPTRTLSSNLSRIMAGEDAVDNYGRKYAAVLWQQLAESAATTVAPLPSTVAVDNYCCYCRCWLCWKCNYSHCNSLILGYYDYYLEACFWRNHSSSRKSRIPNCLVRDQHFHTLEHTHSLARTYVYNKAY